ncbi:hypothetical protein GCM10009127_10420 [Alteraurantiacibacter aestuarii]
MLIRIAENCRTGALGIALAVLAGLAAAPVAAQSIETVDPDMAIDADLVQPSAGPAYDTQAPAARYSQTTPSPATPISDRYADATLDLPPETYPAPAQGASPVNAAQAVQQQPSSTYGSDDLIGAAEGLFGRGAEGLARLIQDLLDEQGEPNGYIVGREGGGAFVLGVRYGSGTLFHAIEGNRPVYWTGPSIGFDAGANAGNTFVLVYNLDNSEELYERFPSGEGQAYLVGGFTASYLRKGNIVLIPIRVGAGLRLGVNAGYMRFSHKQRWLPF